jgi:hypothetical protein
VRDAAGESSHRLHFMRLPKLSLEALLFRLDLFALGNVLAGQQHDRAVYPPHGLSSFADPECSTVFANLARFPAFGPAKMLQAVVEVFVDRAAIGFMNEAGHRPAEQLVDFVAELFRAERVYCENLSGVVDDEVHSRVIIEDVPPLFLAPAKFCFRPLAFGDVHHRACEFEVASVASNGVGRDANVLDPAVGHSKAVLVGKIAAVLRRVCHNLSEVGDILRVYSIVHDQFHRGDYRWAELEDSESFRRPVNPAARRMPAEAARSSGGAVCRATWQCTHSIASAARKGSRPVSIS